MADLSFFKLDSQTINIKDTTALNKINKLESEKADKTLATASANGLMSKSDKAKLDGIDPSAINAAIQGVKDSKTNYVNCGVITAADMDSFATSCSTLVKSAFPFDSSGFTSGMFQAVHAGDDYYYGLWYVFSAMEVDLVFFKQRADTMIKYKVQNDAVVAKYIYQNMSTLSARVDGLGAALNKINELEKLPRVSISYDRTKENITITTSTHSVA